MIRQGGGVGVVHDFSLPFAPEIRRVLTDEFSLTRAFYLVRLRTKQNYLGSKDHQLPIIPGMVASVDILTGKKTILSYLLKPILRAKHTALRER